MTHSREITIDHSKQDLLLVIPEIEWREKVWNKGGNLSKVIRRYVEDPPHKLSEVLLTISSDCDFPYLTATAFRLGYLVDPDYTATDCHWLFTNNWQLQLETRRWTEQELSNFHSRITQSIEDRHKFNSDAQRASFLKAMLETSKDSYLRGRAAFFLAWEYGEESEMVRDTCTQAGYGHIFSDDAIRVDLAEPQEDDLDDSIPTDEPALPGKWSDAVDDLDSADWEDHLGGPDLQDGEYR